MKTRSSYQRGWLEQRKQKNGKKVYLIRWWVRDATTQSGWKKKSETLKECTDKKEALRELDKRLRRVNKAPREDAFSDSITLDDFVKGPWTSYLENQGVKPSTLYSYQSRLRNYALPEFGALKLDEIKPEHLTQFFEKLRQKDLSAKYAANLYGMLKTIFDLAAEYDLIKGSPLRRKLHRPKYRTKEKITLTVEQIQSVLEHISLQWKPLFVSVVLTGLRLGELLELRWRDVDFLSQNLNVSSSLWRGHLLGPKTEASKRTLYIPDLLLQVLLTHKQQSTFTAPDDFVFGRDDGSPCDPDHLRNEVLYPAMDKAGIKRSPRTHGFHLFRHTAGSIVHRETGSVKLAQRQLGHSRMSTTADIYIHPDEEEARRAAEALVSAISCPLFAHLGAPESGTVQ